MSVAVLSFSVCRRLALNRSYLVYCLQSCPCLLTAVPFVSLHRYRRTHSGRSTAVGSYHGVHFSNGAFRGSTCFNINGP